MNNVRVIFLRNFRRAKKAQCRIQWKKLVGSLYSIRKGNDDIIKHKK